MRGNGLIYLTVEQIDPPEIASVFAEATAKGLPVVHGENIRRGGYHYYPTPDRVSRWLAAEGLEIVEEGISSARTYGYLHLLVRDAGALSQQDLTPTSTYKRLPRIFRSACL